ncbi:MAG TPA: tripartite tricarboxylate transporter permease, partial [Burkholderiales bacterium]|nr:tripartite tricarboxylate transporter permease [Burkholderiales bacterium]
MGSLFNAAASIFTSPELMGLIVLGTLIGYVIGAIPGLNAGNVIAILMPLGLRMDPLSLMVFFVAIYGVSELGGSWPGITLNVPGTPASAAVALDGFPMAQRGEGDRALGASTMSAFIGLLVGAVLLGTVTESIGSYALKFGPALMLSITVLGVSAMASMTGQSYVGSIIAGALGLALGTVGVGPLTGAPRATFGILELRGGLPLLPVLIGLFGFAECLVLARKSGGELLPDGVVKNFGTISRTIDGMKEALEY